MGNSEVGHLNLGAGRIVPQDLVRVSDAVADGTLARNPALRAAFAAAPTRPAAAARDGLVSDGGVHSHVDHLRALVGAARRGRRPACRASTPITDGRDVSPHQAAGLLAQLEREWAGTGRAFATVVRALLRHGSRQPLERTRAGYARPIVDGLGERAQSASAAVEASYAAGVTDEFVEPVVMGDRRSAHRTGRSAGVLQLPARPRPADLRAPLTRLRRSAAARQPLTHYDDTLNAHVAFDDEPLHGTLGRRARGRRACGSCTPQRPRNTRT